MHLTAQCCLRYGHVLTVALCVKLHLAQACPVTAASATPLGNLRTFLTSPFLCSALVNKQETMKVQLSDLNKQLLTILASSQGNILENKHLLSSLDNTKAAAVEIADALEASKAMQVELDQQRNAYLAVSVQASNLYFALVDLQALNHMYRFSLASFLTLFQSALVSSARSPDVALRIAAINPVCTLPLPASCRWMEPHSMCLCWIPVRVTISHLAPPYESDG